MKNVIQLLAERLVDAAKQIESELKQKYDIGDFDIQTSSSFEFCRFTIMAMDNTTGDYAQGRGETLEIALAACEKELTPKSEVKARKVARAKELMIEAESL